MTVAYLSHPLGERDTDWDNTRSDNISNAIDWFRFLRRILPSWAICYPAMAYVAADSPRQRPSQLTGMVRIMLACDVLVLVGGRSSPHMQIEEPAARAQGLPVLDLLYFGRMPPWERVDQASAEIARKAEALGL